MFTPNCVFRSWTTAASDSLFFSCIMLIFWLKSSFTARWYTYFLNYQKTCLPSCLARMCNNNYYKTYLPISLCHMSLRTKNIEYRQWLNRIRKGMREHTDTELYSRETPFWYFTHLFDSDSLLHKPYRHPCICISSSVFSAKPCLFRLQRSIIQQAHS